MTKAKHAPPPREPENWEAMPVNERFTLENVADSFLTHLLEEVKLLRHDLEYYRGKCARLELSIMNSETKAEARIEFVERTEENMPTRPSVRMGSVEAGKQAVGAALASDFKKLRDKWDKMSPKEQAEAQGLPISEPQPVVT